MRLDLAMNVKIGDILYNCFMDKVVISKIHIEYKPESIYIDSIIFTAVNSQMVAEKYDYRDIYLLDFDGEDDAEKSWIDWSKDNRDFFRSNDDMPTIKEIFKIGYGRGFDYRRLISYEEMMQK